MWIAVIVCELFTTRPPVAPHPSSFTACSKWVVTVVGFGIPVVIVSRSRWSGCPTIVSIQSGFRADMPRILPGQHIWRIGSRRNIRRPVYRKTSMV
jgi:hypothetical protein